MPDLGQIVFAKTTDQQTGEDKVRPGLVTRVFTEKDGDWAKDKQIVTLSLFGDDGSVDSLDMDKSEPNDNGDWHAGGWADTEEGPRKGSTHKSDPAPATPEPAPAPPVSSPPSVLSDNSGNAPQQTATDSPATNPAAASGAYTATVGDGASSAPATSPV